MLLSKFLSKSFLLSCCAITLCLGPASSAWAVSPSAAPVQAKLVIKKVVNRGNTVVLEDVKTITYDDIVQYTMFYYNDGDTAIKGIDAMLKVPKGMVFVPGSANPKPFQVQLLEPGQFRPYPAGISSNGKFIEVGPSQYQTFFWKLPDLAPRASYGVSVQLRLVARP